jgi:hypothetical protein
MRPSAKGISDNLDDIAPISSSPTPTPRMALRVKAFKQCAQLLRAYFQSSTIGFALMGTRMMLPPVYDLIHQELGLIGDLKLGKLDLLAVMEELVSTAKEPPPYTAPVPHPQSVDTTFAYPEPDLELLRMDLISVPRHNPPNMFHAPDGSDILLAFDTNVHGRFHQQLLELSSRLGRNIRIISLPAVAEELPRGRGGEKRGMNLKALISTGKVKTFGKYELMIGPMPFMDLDGTITMIQSKGDIRIRTESSKVTQQTVDSKPGRKVTFVLGTFDTGCLFLCGSINSGGARILLPRLEEGDQKMFVRVMFNILSQLLL